MSNDIFGRSDESLATPGHHLKLKVKIGGGQTGTLAEIELDGKPLRLVHKVVFGIRADQMIPIVSLHLTPEELDIEFDGPAEVALAEAKATSTGGFIHTLGGESVPPPGVVNSGLPFQVRDATPEEAEQIRKEIAAMQGGEFVSLPLGGVQIVEGAD